VAIDLLLDPKTASDPSAVVSRPHNLYPTPKSTMSDDESRQILIQRAACVGLAAAVIGVVLCREDEDELPPQPINKGPKAAREYAHGILEGPESRFRELFRVERSVFMDLVNSLRLNTPICSTRYESVEQKVMIFLWDETQRNTAHRFMVSQSTVSAVIDELLGYFLTLYQHFVDLPPEDEVRHGPLPAICRNAILRHSPGTLFPTLNLKTTISQAQQPKAETPSRFSTYPKELFEMSSEGMSLLDRVPDEVIRKIFTALCEKDPETEKKALKCLKAFAKYNKKKSEQQAEVSADTKRKAEGPLPDVHLCENCDEGFLEEDNEDDACCYHPGAMMDTYNIEIALADTISLGYLEVNEDSSTWDDWDERTFGDHDNDDNRKEYPEGFTWDCCDARGDEKKGCEVGPHEAVVSIHKRRKLSIDVADRGQGSKDEPIVL
jgi:hypothetical protein